MEIQKFNEYLSKKERRALNELRKRKDIVIKKADKNNICVVMNKNDYIKEGGRQLNTKYYQQKMILTHPHFKGKLKTK